MKVAKGAHSWPVSTWGGICVGPGFCPVCGPPSQKMPSSHVPPQRTVIGASACASRRSLGEEDQSYVQG